MVIHHHIFGNTLGYGFKENHVISNNISRTDIDSHQWEGKKVEEQMDH